MYKNEVKVMLNHSSSFVAMSEFILQCLIGTSHRSTELQSFCSVTLPLVIDIGAGALPAFFKASLLKGPNHFYCRQIHLRGPEIQK